ncbi:MAG: hypothetical protein JXA68_00155 [Ignavibacteriales bacterium]|nr:hypothetical protein [Ignavibacteriales bacterium]
MNYEQDMYIDEDFLDMEFLDQPSLMVKYSTMLADAKRERDLAKEALDLKKAEIDRDVRNNPDNYDLAKITETAILNVILSDDTYKEANKIYNDANYEVNVLQGVVSAIEHRKSALENLVKLYGQNYFAGPSIPHDLKELRKERNKETEHRIGQSLKRNK